MRTFEILEAHLVAAGEDPVSLSAELPQLVAAMERSWLAGEQALVKPLLESVRTGVPMPYEQPIPNVDHEDVPHQDDHDDHWDYAMLGQEDALWSGL